MSWVEIGRWNVGRSDGTSEDYILKRNAKTGDFKIQNDFGNIQIEMELMSGIEFIKRVLEKMENEINDDLNDLGEWLDDFISDEDTDEESEEDCNGQSY